MPTNKPVLCLDFDGVVHQYTSAWTRADEIKDHIVPGFFEWAEGAGKHFRLVIYSSRSKDPKAIEAMQLWLVNERYRWREAGGTGENIIKFEFASEKPAAFLTIDDRAITFHGDWRAPWLDPQQLLGFKPWNKR